MPEITEKTLALIKEEADRITEVACSNGYSRKNYYKGEYHLGWFDCLDFMSQLLNFNYSFDSKGNVIMFSEKKGKEE